jgi:uncharacterized protein YggE
MCRPGHVGRVAPCERQKSAIERTVADEIRRLAPGDRAIPPGAHVGRTATIVTTATGRAEGEPDRVEVRAEVKTRADDPESARDEATSRSDAVRTALAELGLPDDAVGTADFDVRCRRRPPQEGAEGIEYVANYTYQVEVADVDDVGSVVDAAIDAGATGIDDVGFSITGEHRRALRAAALEDAMASARHQATVLADAEGLSITGVVSVETRDVGGPRRRHVAAEQSADEGAPTSFEPGPVTATGSVEATYTAE